jgi:hypothetical protein
MKSHILYLPFVFSAVFLGLFYHQLLGINILIFELLMLGTSLLINKPSKNNVHAHIVLAGTVLSAVFVMLYGSTIAKAVNIFSFFLFLGYRCDINLRSPLNSLLESVLHLVEIPGLMLKRVLEKWGLTQKAISRVRFYGKIVLFPLIIFFVFILMYSVANSRFSGIMADFWTACVNAIEFVFERINFAVAFTLLLGLFISAAYLLTGSDQWVSRIDATSDDRLLRKKSATKGSSFMTMDLKKEYYAMLFLMIALNILIAILNVIDIDWVWLNFKWNGEELKQFVHNGTYMLIIAIICSVSIAMYIFRNNINFYSRNKWIKLLTYAWLFQNAVMLVSVGMRTYRYVEYFNLAHKRIGLMFFLAAMLILIVTVLIKIRYRRSDFYLVRTTAIGSYIVLFMLCTVNWDMVIVNYNFRHAQTAFIHRDWTMTLSDKTLPAIREHLEIIDRSIDSNSWHYGKAASYRELLEKREDAFVEDYKKRGIFSWNYADYRAYKKLEKERELMEERKSELSAIEDGR